MSSSPVLFGDPYLPEMNTDISNLPVPEGIMIPWKSLPITFDVQVDCSGTRNCSLRKAACLDLSLAVLLMEPIISALKSS